MLFFYILTFILYIKNMLEIPNCFYRTSVKWLVLDKDLKFLLCKEITWVRELPGWGLDHGERIEVWLRREFEEEMGVTIRNIAANPCYFAVFINGKQQPAANIIYQVECNNDAIMNFTPSDECVEVWFFNVEEASKLHLLPNVREFIKVFDPINHQ